MENLKRKKLSCCLLIIPLLLILTSCGPSQKDLERCLNHEVLNEKYELIEEARKDGEKYLTYQSTERKLTFHCYGHTARNILTEGNGYKTDYPYKVHEQYLEEIQNLLESKLDVELITYEPEGAILVEYTFNVYLNDESELEDALYVIREADMIYQKELEYNDSAWLKNHPFGWIKIFIDKKEVNKLIAIDGSFV